MNLKSIFRYFLVLIILIVSHTHTRADDPGITKVRLIQLSDSSYVFEADVPEALLGSIDRPIFPARFKESDFSFTNESGWITLRLTYSTTGDPLSADDEILLQWNRNGADITTQWTDGTTYKALFYRTLGGIHIPLSDLMLIEKSNWEVFQKYFFSGLGHFTFKGLHILLIVILVLAYPFFKSLSLLLWLTAGQAFAMVLAELGMPGFDLLLSDLYLLLVILLVSILVVYKRNLSYLGPLLLIGGIIHGLSFLHEIDVTELQPLQRIQALFAFNIAIDLGQYLLSFVLGLIFYKLLKVKPTSGWPSILLGAFSVFLILLVFRNNVVRGSTQILEFQSNPSVTSINAPPRSNVASQQVQRGSGLMKTPVVIYLSVEPYEVRQEILIQANSAMEILGMDKDLSVSIPVELQGDIKKELSDSIAANTSVQINTQLVEPSEVQAHFVTLNRGGVSSRQSPVSENLDEGIIGITLIYETESYPDSVGVDWELFTFASTEIEASAVDLHGAFTVLLSPENNKFVWKNRLAGYKAPIIEIIEVINPPVPLLSIIILIGVLMYTLYCLIMKKGLSANQWIIISLGVAFICYPYLRSNLELPFLPQGKPSKERAAIIMNDLLTNVYRAFDRRGEDHVYDRLALTVTGDQLTDIYMQNRQSMAMESRGGARAKVDEINIQDLFEVDRSEDGGFVADVLWTIRGSVNHFGHTHYRQNQYRALVSFVDDNDTWKINHIETIDERRLY